MTTPWPPVIGAAHVSPWARLRDIALTVAAWALLGYLLIPMLRALWIDMQVVLGLSPPAAVPALERLWNDLRPFLGLLALMLLWMLCYAAIRRVLIIRSQRAATQSTSLDRATHVHSMSSSPEAAEQLQQARIAVVEFDADFRIVVAGTSRDGQGTGPRPGTK